MNPASAARQLTEALVVATWGVGLGLVVAAYLWSSP